MSKNSPKRKEILKAIKKTKSAKDYDQMVVLCKEAHQRFPEDAKFERLLHFAQAHYVNQKLKSDVVKSLEAKGDYETLMQVYQKLLGVFPGSPLLLKLLKEVRTKINEAAIKERAEYFKRAAEHIKAEIKEQKFDQAMQGCYEILSYEPENKTFLTLLKKTQIGRNRLIEKELQEYLNKEIPELQAAFKQNKEGFIRV